MGYDGWKDLKDDYLKEEEYLEKHFVDIDANYPFKKNDNIMTIASKIAVLRNESVNDTLSLITHDDLQQAISIIRKSKGIYLYAASNNLNIVQEFKHNMSRIKQHVEIAQQQGETVFTASLQPISTCAIIVSYSGETGVLCRVARTLKLRGIPMIAITNIGDNTISKLSNVTLRITTRERLFSKIATFSTDSAIAYLLDVLYSCVYALDYDKNTQFKSEMSKIVEKGRFSTTTLIHEDVSKDDYYHNE